VGVGIGVIAQAIYLYTHRPKPWNATAVTATPIRAYVGRDITFSVQYRVRNNTDRDLRLQLRGVNAAGMSEWRVFERTFRGLTPLPSETTRLADTAVDREELFLPPSENVGLTINALFLLHPEDSRADIVEKLRQVKFDGFVIYDAENRVRIDLPFDEAVIQAK
jgi:hypothetical protein